LIVIIIIIIIIDVINRISALLLVSSHSSRSLLLQHMHNTLERSLSVQRSTTQPWATCQRANVSHSTSRHYSAPDTGAEYCDEPLA